MSFASQSNPTYYSLSSVSTNSQPTSRTVTLRRASEQSSFGVYIGQDVPAGLYVVTVERNSPAAAANIQPGDRVLEVNGQLVSSMSKNPNDLLIKAASQSLTLTLTIQSTDILEQLNIPLANTNHRTSSNPATKKFLSSKALDMNSDLEG